MCVCVCLCVRVCVWVSEWVCMCVGVFEWVSVCVCVAQIQRQRCFTQSSCSDAFPHKRKVTWFASFSAVTINQSTEATIDYCTLWLLAGREVSCDRIKRFLLPPPFPGGSVHPFRERTVQNYLWTISVKRELENGTERSKHIWEKKTGGTDKKHER